MSRAIVDIEPIAGIDCWQGNAVARDQSARTIYMVRRPLPPAKPRQFVMWISVAVEQIESIGGVRDDDTSHVR